jgi:hypothetical protein
MTCVTHDARSDLLFTMSDNSAFARADRRETNANSCSGRTFPTGGARRDRTDDLLLAKQALSQLSYGPDVGGLGWFANRSGGAAKVGGPGKT